MHRIFFCSLVLCVLSACAGNFKPMTQTHLMLGIPDYAIVQPKAVYRGGQPNAVGWAYLKQELGVRTVIKLNPETPLASDAMAEALGMQVIPTEQTLRKQGMSPDKLHDAWVGPQQEMVDYAMKTLLNPANQPVYVHCSHGWDRTGLIVAMYRVCHDGYSKEQAFTEMVKHGHNKAHQLLFYKGLTQYWKQFSVSDCARWQPVVTP